MGIILVLTAIPFLDMFLMLGTPWPSVLPVFGDEPFNPARVQTIVKGSFIGGSPYFLEHHYDLPLVIFAGTWINALPQLLGLPQNVSLVINFVLWSLLFAVSLYILFRELRIPPWVAVFGTVALYLHNYAHVWRPVNLQPVYPFYFLFYVALIRLVREQNRKNIAFLALMTGAMFYLYSYMWQAFLITLGLLFLWALIRKHRSLMRATFLSAFWGGVIGSPMLLYALWLSRTSPYFWESVGRLGLVNTHIPMAEVVYSGGWVGVTLAFLALLFWRSAALRADKDFAFLSFFLAISGLGLWVMQGSNLVTGKLLETGEHLRLFILPWLLFATLGIGTFLWKLRAHLSYGLRVFAIAAMILLSVTDAHYAYDYFSPFLPTATHPDRWHPEVQEDLWRTEQLYAKPFAWLQEHETEPVVVWSDPHDFLTPNLPTLTRHFTLYAMYGMLELMPEGEVRERYLVSQYFNNPTLSDLRTEREMRLYLGRGDYPHRPKTIAREIKVCHILFFWDTHKDCGTPPTYQSFVGDKLFTDMENKFQNDIKPNIKAYLKKYHVSYILKDKQLNPKYHPETLGATLVYADERYEIYHL
jgi:hypothetical protein